MTLPNHMTIGPADDYHEDGIDWTTEEEIDDDPGYDELGAEANREEIN